MYHGDGLGYKDIIHCSFWSFLHLFASQMGGGPLLHWSIGSRLRWRLFWRLHINSSWSSGTMLLTYDNKGHIWEDVVELFEWSYPKQKQHEGLDGYGSPDNATQEPMATDQHPRVQVVIAEKEEELFLAKVLHASFNWEESFMQMSCSRQTDLESAGLVAGEASPCIGSN